MQIPNAIKDQIPEQLAKFKEEMDDPRTWFDQKTLDEIREHDIDNLAHIYKDCLWHSFTGTTKTQEFVNACISRAVEKCGITLSRKLALARGNKVKLTGNIDLEWRSKYRDGPHDCHNCSGAGSTGKGTCPKCQGSGKVEEENTWRNGIYVYYKNEIMAFVSEVRRFYLNGVIVRPGLPRDGSYMVCTNMGV